MKTLKELREDMWSVPKEWQKFTANLIMVLLLLNVYKRYGKKGVVLVYGFFLFNK